MSRTLRYALIAALGISGVLLFLLAAGTGNTQLFAKYYNTLLAANLVLSLALFIVVFALIWRLVRRRLQNRFGAKLTGRFALAFALTGLVPGVVIYVVSALFLTRSIESWFNTRVDSALESGLKLTQSVLDAQLTDITNRSRGVAAQLASLPDANLPAEAARLRELFSLSEVTVFTSTGRVLTTVGPNLLSLRPDLPSSALMRQVRTGGGSSTLESEAGEPDTGAAGREARELRDPRLRMRVVLPLYGGGDLTLRAESRYLQVLQPVAPSLAQNAETVRAGYQDYKELSLAREGLSRMYALTLTLALLLSISASISIAFLLANAMSAPLLTLADGTRAVAAGDFRPLPLPPANDELALLTASFNTMSRQLGDAQAATESSQRALQEANVYLESVLTNLSAGVLVFDADARLTTYNESAVRILGQSLANKRGAQIADALPEPLAHIIAIQEAHGQDHWQQQVALERGEGITQTLLVRGAALPLPVAEGGEELHSAGRVVVFDDVSDVIAAQRATAWAEVARRLAHEIKNPLTPIQLSAERLSHRLADKVQGADAEMLAKGTATIVNQVAALKRMVDEFRDYARLPHAQLEPLDLNALIEDVLRLYEADCAPGGRIALELAPQLPLIEGDAAQLRQVIHNLVKNALDACEQAKTTARPCVVVRTAAEIRIVDEVAKNQQKRVKFAVSDKGSGFPAKILARAFEPYVTTKAGGTGLGLAIVRRIVDEHAARVSIRNRDSGGAEVEITFTKLAREAVV
jgi:nitrogen fixation/metabolism regulation signal transduction histidine kinase